ncbi:MAG: helix-turn-helix transcriptional regulator [Ruminococcaceae bacterium]|nr:helix-turn-helix transcriptional regulator [Oscillospiraceae bacterium]
MEDIKLIISKNIVMLRKRSGMTQIELAEKLNYSDKAVSKWERGESVPDIVVLKEIADIFDVTVDYLITEDHPEPKTEQALADAEVPQYARDAKKHRMHRVVTGMSVLLVWVIATLLFVIFDASLNRTNANFLIFGYAIVASMIVWLVFNSIWHNRRRNYLIVSGLMWSVLLSVHLSILVGGFNLWQIYLLGIPGQLIVALWSIIGRKK